MTAYSAVGKMHEMRDSDSCDLRQEVREAVSRALVQEFGRADTLRMLVLFGSRARGRQRASSDVDLAVAMDAPLQGQEQQHLQASISAALRTDTDLVDLLSAPSHLVSQILRHGEILVGARSPALGSIIAKMVSEREDIAPYQRRILEERVR